MGRRSDPTSVRSQVKKAMQRMADQGCVPAKAREFYEKCGLQGDESLFTQYYYTFKNEVLHRSQNKVKSSSSTHDDAMQAAAGQFAALSKLCQTMASAYEEFKKAG